MKHITVFALLLLSLTTLSQKPKVTFDKVDGPPTYNGVEIYSEINELKDKLLDDSGNKLVSHSGNKLVISSNAYGVLSTLVFKSNPTSGIVYHFSRTITGGPTSGMSPIDAYQYQVEQIVTGSGYYPYDENSDMKGDGVYSKWLFNGGLMTVKLNQYAQLVVQLDRIYGQDIEDFVNSLQVKK